MSILEQNKKLIQNIYEIYTANGFITEDQIFNMMIESNISLHAIDVLTGELLDRGVIIASESEETDEDGDNDRTRTDYNIIFTEAVSVSPGLLPFIEYIKDIRPPQRNEWRVLMPQAKAGNQYAFNRLFEMYLRVVVKLALNFYKRYGYELDDLLQEGTLGLMKAIRNFDFIIHGSFVSYFPFWVKQRIDRAIADKSRLIRIPVHMHQTMENMQTAIIKLEMNNGCMPSTEEISNELGIPCDEVEQIQSYFHEFESIEDYLAMHNDDNFIGYNLIDTTSFNEVDKRLLRDAIISALNTLTNREASIVRLRFGIDDQRERTLEEVGTVFNLTRERIRQIEAKALRRLRHPSWIKKLKGYLD